jgi:hypothetical protein
MKAKYIKTSNDVIIVFSELLQHMEFESFAPKSAGFISIGASGRHAPEVTCYGESISLNIKSDKAEDTRLARKQILGYMD